MSKLHVQKDGTRILAKVVKKRVLWQDLTKGRDPKTLLVRDFPTAREARGASFTDPNDILKPS